MSNPWHPENGQQPPEPDWARWEAEHGPPPLESVKRPAPVDVETARHLWWGVALLGMINLLATLIVVYGDRSVFAQQLVDDVMAQDASIPLTVDSAESYLIAALVVMVAIGVGFGALFLFWVNKMRMGKMWARMLLTMIGTVTVVLTVPQLFGFGANDGAMAIVLGVAGILQGVLAAGAIYLMHRKDSNEYFFASRKS
ncbi:hypothetical protein [Rhodococcoides kyotonense]|uniref:Uncharacterized protein n=1 Tax=Rhodococcoides kyotonense TaxID=398843 RepID=A0A239M6B9_9NOCA|nr:hypothetical protein [Rhodococcus kyotonensis]SNT38151.1 hypothetical protein SAMN05421642_11646 [Rhodococcus kyotonensis]